jgi:TetR/AcrR family transcriptional repressor of uid operon
MPPGGDKRSERAPAGGREAQRQQTRKRVYAAALAEFKRAGLAGADVGAIVAAAGVARGTFYFHFPTKEHVVAELERSEEVRVVVQLSAFLARLETGGDSPPAGAGYLPAALAEVIRLIMATERRMGKTLFREMLGLHFSPRRPALLPGADQWAEYPILTVLVGAIERAQARGEVHAGVDAVHTAQFFLIGLYAMLSTSHDASRAARAEILDNFLATVVRGVEAR